MISATVTAPLETGTMLAYERTRVAYERTMMAWIRTGTSLITFGFAVYKFFELELPGNGISASLIGPRGFGAILIGTGMLSLVMGMAEHRRDLALLAVQYPGMPKSMSVWAARLMAAFGALALAAVAFRG